MGEWKDKSGNVAGFHHKAVTHGHIVTAIYNAARREPANPFVIATLRRGLSKVILIHPRTPWDVQLHIVRFDNAMPAQVVFTLREFFVDLRSQQLHLQDAMAGRGIRKSTCGRKEFSYSARSFEVMMELFPSAKFSNATMFANARCQCSCY